jgi:hypothetical protein
LGRANAVRQHLVFFYDISAIGSPLLDAARGNFSTPQIPESGVNRSVQIVNEGH